MSSHNGRVDHEVVVVRVFGENLEDHLPHARSGPSGEALVVAFPVAVSFGHVAPIGTAAQHPQHTVDESPVIRGRLAPVSHLAREKVFDLVPLRLYEFVSLWHDPTRSVAYAPARPILP